MHVVSVWRVLTTECYQYEFGVVSGVTGEDEKWRYCVGDASGAVSFAVGAMYVRETFHGDSKASVSNVIYTHTHTCRNSLNICLTACFFMFTLN